MSDTPKQYAFAIGMVQAFTKDGVKQPAVKVGNANGQTVHNFTIKTPNGNYVDIALWAEYAHVAPSIQEGFVVFADGSVTTRESNGKVYHSINPFRLAVIPCVQRQEREVVNQQPAAVAAAPVAAAPVAAAPAAQAAPAAAPAAAPFSF